MNRTFSAITLQSVAAAAVLVAAAPFAMAAAPSHNSETGFEANVAAATIVSSASPADVRQGALVAARQHLNSETGSLQAARQPFVSAVSRADVRAAAVEAVRTGRVGGYSAQNMTTVSM